MSNFELIDGYLTDRLSGEEKVAFEKRLESDPALQADVDMQKDILEGVKRARVAELKAMLNNVPIGGGLSGGIVAGKIAAAFVAAGIIGASLYIYLKPTSATKEETPLVTEKKIEPSAPNSKATDAVTPSESATAPVRSGGAITEKPKSKTAKKMESSQPKVTRQPAIDVTDPSDELVDNSTHDVAKTEGQKSAVTTSSIVVETNSSIKKYNFHYQFNEGKLVLYGSFDKSLYEILEIHGDRHAVFLFYKENYFLLDEKQKEITPLTAIKDAALLRKLKEYRGR